MTGPTVVKLGGSYAGAAECREWLEALAQCRGQVVVVPGGGPFAETVRDAQRAMGFDDRAAHRMALLAMEQYACALANLGGCELATSADEIRRVLGLHGLPVWAPTSMVLDASELPQSWGLTSDSLAAWLTGKLRVRRLLLVKRSVPCPRGLAASALAAAGLVDPLFPRFLGASGAEGYIAGPADHAAAAAAIRSAAPPGLRIALP